MIELPNNQIIIYRILTTKHMGSDPTSNGNLPMSVIMSNRDATMLDIQDVF